MVIVNHLGQAQPSLPEVPTQQADENLFRDQHAEFTNWVATTLAHYRANPHLTPIIPASLTPTTIDKPCAAALQRRQVMRIGRVCRNLRPSKL